MIFKIMCIYFLAHFRDIVQINGVGTNYNNILPDFFEPQLKK